MRKGWLFILIIVFGLTISSQTEQKKLDIITEYIYQAENLLISETDLYCSYFITKNMSQDMRIIGAEDMYTNKLGYTDGEKMYINKGANDGLKEGDLLMIIEKGKTIFNPLNFSRLGTYYLKKSRAEICCIYDDKAGIVLKNGCHPVKIGDLVIPFQEEAPVYKKSIDYTSCRLIESGVRGNVVMTNLSIDVDRYISGPADWITVDLGKAELSRGDFVLFYKILKKNLPPLIVGTGIVLNPQNTNSTVKILDVSHAVEVGDKFILLPAVEDRPRKITGQQEDIPIVEQLRRESPEVREGEESKEFNILFALNSKEIAPEYQDVFDQIKAFTTSKTELVVILRGYTCSIGGLEYNLKLSQERVDAIKAYLINQLSINESFIETYFYGEKDAPFDNTSEEERRKNRLVNIQIIGK